MYDTNFDEENKAKKENGEKVKDEQKKKKKNKLENLFMWPQCVFNGCCARFFIKIRKNMMLMFRILSKFLCIL